MNKNKIIIGIISTIFILSAPISFAQNYVIPAPVCIDTPGIPCPDRGNSYDRAQKPTSASNIDVPTGFSKTFDYLSSFSTKIGNVLNQTIEGLKNWFKNLYDSLRTK